LIIVVPGCRFDLGVLSYNHLNNDGTLNSSSAYDLVETTLRLDKDTGFLVANPGQLLWHYATKRTLTFASWSALPRGSAAEGPYQIHEKLNIIEGQTNADEHIAFFFDTFVKDKVPKTTKIQIIAAEDAGEKVISYLQSNCTCYQPFISGD
jgi:hypothetical protein